MFYLGFENFEVKEGEFVEVPVLRNGNLSVVSSVRIATSSRCAGENDYEPINRIVCFAAYENCKLIKIYAKTDYLTELEEYFTIQLLAVEANTIGSPNIARIKIIDMPQTN
jgi:hypothetical protein